jgi:hypothetical protein
MNEIEEQYAIYLAKGVVLDKDGFPLGSNDVHVLGGGGPGVGVCGVASSSKAAAAAESRRKKNANGLTQGYVLGGKKRAMPKDPREAARIAAERRLLDSQFCLPCNEVIEILGTDSSDEDEVDDKGDIDVVLVESATEEAKMSSKPKSKRKNHTKPKAFDYTTTTTATSSDDSIIDLTEDSFDMTNSSSFDDLNRAASATAQKKSRLSPPKQNQAMSANDDGDCDREKAWTCPRCTLCNTSIVLVCEACNLERQPSKQQQKKLCDDEINYIKQNEVDQSLRTFGGFNIYGEKKES